MAWGGFSNGQIPLSAMRAVQGNNYFEPSFASLIEQLIAQASARGVNIQINEGYRPLGVPNDQNIRNESQTSTGGSNQWYQVGRQNRGETPSAATPGTSSHGWGQAADINPGANNATVNAIAQSLGLAFPITSESWHCAVANGAGSSASQGREIQSLLNNFGYNLVVDGIVGQKTISAIKDFQAKHGLVVDGVVGPKTMAALQSNSSSGGNVAGNAEVQRLLNALGYGLAEDGIIGTKSKAAIKDFQSRNGLVADGVVGPVTTKALRDAVASKPAPVAPPVVAPIVTPVVLPVKPITPKPTTPPVKPKPVRRPKPSKQKVTKVATKTSEDQIASLPSADLGVIIPTVKGRKIAYALYAGCSLVVTNTAVAFAALGANFPAWLTVSIAIVGNLATPFAAIAISNASNKK